MGCVGKRTEMETNGMDRGSGLCILVGLTRVIYANVHIYSKNVCQWTFACNIFSGRQKTKHVMSFESEFFLSSLEPYQLWSANERYSCIAISWVSYTNILQKHSTNISNACKRWGSLCFKESKFADTTCSGALTSLFLSGWKQNQALNC